MEVKIHPILGIPVREYGAVCVRKPGSRRFYWFYGHKNTKGYCKVKVNGKYRHIGRIVLEAFIGFPTDGLQCDHIDRNRANNHISNLRWVTPPENSRNTTRSEHSKSKYGCNWYTDPNAYHRKWSKLNRPSRNRSAQKYRNKKKEVALCVAE